MFRYLFSYRLSLTNLPLESSMQGDLHVEFGKRWLREILAIDFHHKLTGLYYSEYLSQLHFWLFFLGVNITFFPMHYLGVAGMPRRIPDYPDAFYVFNKIATWGSYVSGLSVLIFFWVLIDAFRSQPVKN